MRFSYRASLFATSLPSQPVTLTNRRPNRASRVFARLPFLELGPAIADKGLGVFRGHIDSAVFPDDQMPTRVCLHGSSATRRTKANPRATPLFELLGLPPAEFIDAPAVHRQIEHIQGSAAGVGLVVMGEIGEAFEDAEEVLVPAAAPDLEVADAALRTERSEPRDLVATF